MKVDTSLISYLVRVTWKRTNIVDSLKMTFFKVKYSVKMIYYNEDMHMNR